MWAANIIYGLSRMVMPLRYKVEFEGAENLPKEGPVLLLAKHQRLDDIPLGLMVLQRFCRKDIYCIMKDSLAKWYFFGLIVRAGGIPLNRKNPEKSKLPLLFARDMLHAGKLMVIFPEQTFFPNKMGRGKTPGFRFIAGRPEKPLNVNVIGFRYKKEGFRTTAHIRIGQTTQYDATNDPDEFLHERMHQMAELSLLTYPYKRPVKGQTAAEQTNPE
jgi:1-acyl-sn-glycerol-3-phosphate acyltransferase